MQTHYVFPFPARFSASLGEAGWVGPGSRKWLSPPLWALGRGGAGLGLGHWRRRRWAAEEAGAEAQSQRSYDI